MPANLPARMRSQPSMVCLRDTRFPGRTFHVQNAIKAGDSRRERVEAGFQAVVMHGGPAFMWMTLLLQAVDEFSPAGDES